jgi:site-specific DNA-methyltransferase (adenine-specific)
MMTPGLYSSNKSDWSTPKWLFDEIDAVFHFTLDVAADMFNCKCNKWFGPNENGLKQDWSNEVCWMNPPYGREIGKWVEKARTESIRGATVVCLLPARTDTKWFHNSIVSWANYIGFIKGRISFGSYDGDGYKESPAPFPSMLVVFDRQCIYNPLDVITDIYWTIEAINWKGVRNE